MYDPIIFDLDGTLLNTLGDLADACNHALEKHGFPVYPEEQYKTFVGNGIPNLIKRILPENASEDVYNAAYAEFSEYYARHKADRTAPYPDIPELLAELKKRGITAVCNTNKAHGYSVDLLNGFFGDLLAEVSGDSGRFPRKPAPDAALYFSEKYKRENANPLYVGDSSVDMQTARNAGIDACGVLWGFRTRDELERFSPKFIAENTAQLREYILNG